VPLNGANGDGDVPFAVDRQVYMSINCVSSVSQIRVSESSYERSAS
jgi:hypothetical protein